MKEIKREEQSKDDRFMSKEGEYRREVSKDAIENKHSNPEITSDPKGNSSVEIRVM